MKKYFMFVVIFMFMLSATENICLAAEETQIEPGNVYRVLEDTQMYESADAESAKTADILVDSAVIVLSYDGGEWCEAGMGEIKGYIRISVLGILGDAQALEQEFANIGNDYENAFEEALEIQRQERNSKIWGAVIVVLVVAIFAVGIISALRKNEETADEER